MLILFFITFAVMVLVIAFMAIGVMFGRSSIKGSCGGVNGGECACLQKCEKKRNLETVSH